MRVRVEMTMRDHTRPYENSKSPLCTPCHTVADKEHIGERLIPLAHRSSSIIYERRCLAYSRPA